MAKKISKTNPQPRSMPRRSAESVFGSDKKPASEAAHHLEEEGEELRDELEEELTSGSEVLPMRAVAVEVEPEPDDDEEIEEVEEVRTVEPVVREVARAKDAAPRAPVAAPAKAPAAPRLRLSLGKPEMAIAAGCLLFALVCGALFFKFLYAHAAPLKKEELARHFETPLKGSLVTLESVSASWRDRTEADRAQKEESVLPTFSMTLASGQPASGFVRVEFVDSEGKLRGDVYVLAVEGGKFQDSSRGEVISPDGRQATVTATVGFWTHALYASYSTGEEPRWSIRVKEGADASDGPWNLLGAAEIPNK